MSRSYAIVDTKGRVIGGNSGVSSVRPIELEQGERVSIQELYYDNDASWIAEVHYSGKGYTAIVYSDTWVSKGQYQHHVKIIGTDPLAAEEAMNKISHMFGAVDRDLDFPLRYSMPEIKGFWRRIKFLFWDYLICGRIEPKPQKQPKEEIDMSA